MDNKWIIKLNITTTSSIVQHADYLVGNGLQLFGYPCIQVCNQWIVMLRMVYSYLPWTPFLFHSQPRKKNCHSGHYYYLRPVKTFSNSYKFTTWELKQKKTARTSDLHIFSHHGGNWKRLNRYWIQPAKKLTWKQIANKISVWAIYSLIQATSSKSEINEQRSVRMQ